MKEDSPLATSEHDLRLEVGHRWRFLSSYLRSPNVVGAIAPSSRRLAVAICAPFQTRERPAAVLEVGAGTGAITRHLGTLLGTEDQLDICEISDEFADILERDVLSLPQFVGPVREGRVRLLRQPVQEVSATGKYDYVLSGLPLTAFTLQDVEEIYAVIRRSMKASGVFTYYEYSALRLLSVMFSLGSRRTRIHGVSAFLSKQIREHEFERHLVVRNVPPAHVRHLCFDGHGAT